jgi:RimJ/RimL family protein N-acetyltransferase
MRHPIIETERLFLRKPRPEDMDTAIQFFGSKRAKFVSGPLSADRAWRQLTMFIGHWELRGYGMFAVVPKGEDNAIGVVGPWNPIDWPELELGWHIWSDAHEGKGFAFEAAVAAREYATNALGWRDPVSYVRPDNARSIALAKRLGAVIDTTASVPPGSNCIVFRHPNRTATERWAA